MKQNMNKGINYDSNKFFHNFECQKKLRTLPSMSSNKRRDPKLTPTTFIANSALSTRRLNGVGV